MNKWLLLLAFSLTANAQNSGLPGFTTATTPVTAGLVNFTAATVAKSVGLAASGVVAACGTSGTYPSLVAANQTLCGSTTPYPAAPISPTLISTCSQTLAASTKYQLSADLSCGDGTLAMTINGPNTILDFKGHTVTGGIVLFDPNGDHIYSSAAGATIVSNQDPGTITAGFYGNISTANLNTIFEFDHISFTNNSVGATNSARNFFMDYGSVNTGSLCGSITTEVHNITSTSAVSLTSLRIVNLQVQGVAHGTCAYPEFYNNTTTCLSNAAACQGIVAFGVYAHFTHNNNIINQLNNASSTETPRGFIEDQTDGGEFVNNYCNTQDGRCYRTRGSTNIHPVSAPVNSMHDNYVDNIVVGTNSNHVAAVHIGDPDTGTEAENWLGNHNVFNFTSGQIAMQRDATAATLQDNTVLGTGSTNLMFLRITGVLTTVGNVLRTTITGGGSLTSTCEAGTTSLICQSGTSGTCTVNNASC